MKKVNKNSGFKVPEGYFDSLPEQIFSKMEMEKINYTKGSDFTAPEGYFDTFTDKMIAQLELEESEGVPVRSLNKYYYIAASIAAILILIVSLQWNSKPITNGNILAISDIENYFDLNGLGISSYELAEMFPGSDMDINDILDNQLDNESVIDYLSINIQDLEELNLSNDD